MLKISLIDQSADARRRLLKEVEELARCESEHLALLPPLSSKPIAPEELKFHAAPDMCLIGPEILTNNLNFVSIARKALPDTPILVRLDSAREDLSTIEHLADLGADGTFTERTSPADFFKILVLLCRKRRSKASGKLIAVEGGKGGMGVSTVAAAIADSLLHHGDQSRVAIVDLDFQSQDLSRFLQCRPFVNENLQLLLEGSRSVSEETVQQCLSPVWSEDDRLFCMPPCADSEELYSSRSQYTRNFLSIFEILDELFDAVIVDLAGSPGPLSGILSRIADLIVFVVDNDPAALYAGSQRLQALRAKLAPNAKLIVFENCPDRCGLPQQILKREFCLAAKLEVSEFSTFSMPYSSTVKRWPASGETPYGIRDRRVQRAVDGLLLEAGLKSPQRVSVLAHGYEGLLKKIQERSSGLLNYSGKKTVPALQIEIKPQLTAAADRMLPAGPQESVVTKRRSVKPRDLFEHANLNGHDQKSL